MFHLKCGEHSIHWTMQQSLHHPEPIKLCNNSTITIGLSVMSYEEYEVF